ncbi:hypothetical protein HMPREF9318_00155 [Streptococcus urinalis FB127-CNA-2]|uniref:Cell cycle protein, FtsW/RodA/SpoVE family n=1 Tax=Streptococcus urinalis 2285-97 TaxID=764291 RepID=G5KEZ0_9STRE|nr:FtsW/RodA/SpoVE family cell cycle protein [Streptococcus urinalis]EHJ56945.1 cell cycle protein, FtsW/RodA/SpoVE family [Streptococcus urinalis 2285-97]EKS21957.1 hypothetical protein HMPREF9318_00155 [Streptococcus urinalis FB127-CNA-2]VEF31770.1 rod shape determining protein [Streptococcus urinalis]
MSDKSKGIDFWLITPVLILLATGLLSIYIASSHDYPKEVVSIMSQQALWLVIGCLIAAVVMLFSTEFLWKVTPFLYAFGLILMVLPIFYYSPTLYQATGAKNWINIQGVTLFQPSEFMKIAYILMLARLSIWFKQKEKQPSFKNDWKVIGLYTLVTIPVLALLALQKDFGTALVFMAIYAGMLILAGISWWIILPTVLLVVVFIISFIVLFSFEQGKEFLFNIGMDTYQINRISAWLNPFDFAESIAYQQTQGMIAIGSGGIHGSGFDVANLAVPVRESDMIFTVIAENFGFLGSAFILALYLLIIYRMIRVTFASNNKFYTYISTGFIMMILFHIFENIGASLGILPLTGIPLPFISQGGSSLVSNLIGVGLVLSMYHQNYYQDNPQTLVYKRRKSKKKSH